MLGGNINPTPGEISLAHNGVLFLDELPEFKRSVLETMRQPLEEGRVTISRAAGTMTFPSQFMLVAAMNPTPDGKMPGESKSSPREIQNYLGRISGPLLDRIDLHIEVPQVKFREMTGEQTGETSAQIRDACHRRAAASARAVRGQAENHLQRADGLARTEIILRTRRGDEGTAEVRDDGFEFKRPRLRPHFESGADDCRSGRCGKNHQRPRLRSDPIPLARPAIVGMTPAFTFSMPVMAGASMGILKTHFQNT